VLVHPCDKASTNAVLPPNTRIITPKVLGDILGALSSAIIHGPYGEGREAARSAAKKLAELRLTLDAVVSSRAVKPG
jgi:hypothetical protein